MNLLSLQASLLITGMGGILVQILLLRELLVSFFGNELTIGIILANWLLLEAAGSFLAGRRTRSRERELELFISLQLIFAIGFPLAVFLARTAKNLIVGTVGEGIGFIPVTYLSLLTMLPVSITHGALFTVGCKLYSQLRREDAPTIGRVYVLETIGSIGGGLLLAALLFLHIDSFTVAFAISLLTLLACLFLLRRRPGFAVTPLATSLKYVTLIFAFTFAALFAAGQVAKIDRFAVNLQWRGIEVVHNEMSMYSHITITRQEEQLTFHTDGIPTITTPHPNVAWLESLVHFPLLIHPQPGSLLILGGAAGGMLHEILKHPVKEVHYIELDPLLMRLLRQFPTPLTESELNDERVRIHYGDGRYFVINHDQKFDIIFVGPSLPQDLQTNRLFSIEFFSAAKERLNPGGILVLTLPGSLTYLSAELADLNRSILDTLRSVYPRVEVIPGDINLFLASDAGRTLVIPPAELAVRLEERGIETSLFSLGYIEYRLLEQWLRPFIEGTAAREGGINSDFQPLAVYHSLSLINALFSPELSRYFQLLGGLRLELSLVVLLVVFVLAAGIFLTSPPRAVYSVPLAIGSTGFASMVLDLAIIFTFQTLFGFLYFQIVLLLTIFAAGVAIGGIYMTRQLDRVKNTTKLFLVLETLVVVFSLLLPFVFLIPAPYLDNPLVYDALYLSFLIASFLCGAITGLQFPLASKVYLTSSPGTGGVGRTAGSLYGADLFGGFLGGLLGGVILLPVLGLQKTCFLLGMIKIASLMLFFLYSRTSGLVRRRL